MLTLQNIPKTTIINYNIIFIILKILFYNNPSIINIPTNIPNKPPAT